MLNIKGMRVSEYFANLWETEREQNRIEYQDENGELDTNDDISFLSIGTALDKKTIEYKIFLYNNKVIRKAIPSEVLQLFATSIQSIRINRYGYCLTTDLYDIIYDFNGKIETVEEL